MEKFTIYNVAKRQHELVPSLNDLDSNVRSELEVKDLLYRCNETELETRYWQERIEGVGRVLIGALDKLAQRNNGTNVGDILLLVGFGCHSSNPIAQRYRKCLSEHNEHLLTKVTDLVFRRQFMDRHESSKALRFVR